MGSNWYAACNRGVLCTLHSGFSHGFLKLISRKMVVVHIAVRRRCGVAIVLRRTSFSF